VKRDSFLDDFIDDVPKCPKKQQKGKFLKEKNRALKTKKHR